MDMSLQDKEILIVKYAEKLSQAVLPKNQEFKMVGLKGDKVTGVFVRACMAAEQMNLACITVSQSKATAAVYEALNNLNLEHHVKYFVLPVDDNFTFFVSSLMLPGNNIPADQFNSSLNS